MESANHVTVSRLLEEEKLERRAAAGMRADDRLDRLEAKLARIEDALVSFLRHDDERLGVFVAQCFASVGVKQMIRRLDALEARPGIKYLGTFREGRVYDEGSLITFDGSVWHANQRTTTPPGNGAAAWTLCVKHGERGRDGKDA